MTVLTALPLRLGALRITGCDVDLVSVASICTLIVKTTKASSASICGLSRIDPTRDETKATLSATVDND
jgi:hypothetical protein